MQAENAQERRLASLQRQQQEQQWLPPPHCIVGPAVNFGAVTVHSAALLAEICGEPEPESELVPPPIRGSSGGSVSVNVDTLVCTLHLDIDPLHALLPPLPACRARGWYLMFALDAQPPPPMGKVICWKFLSAVALDWRIRMLPGTRRSSLRRRVVSVNVWSCCCTVGLMQMHQTRSETGRRCTQQPTSSMQQWSCC